MAIPLKRTISLLACTICTQLMAAPVPSGYISWDVNIPGSSGNFNISNFTGPNALDPDFPIVTPLQLSALSLVVDFEGGGRTVFGPSYFVAGPDGLSFDGGDIAIGGTNPLPTAATLTGNYTTTPVTLADGRSMDILDTFTASLGNGSGALSDGDLAVIFASPRGGTVPLPGSFVLVLSGIAALAFGAGARPKPGQPAPASR